jgi:hypothetical protein
MYRQISVDPQDRDLQRILWRYSTDEPIQEYRLTTVTYGTSSLSFLATRCLKKLADDNKHQHPQTSDDIMQKYSKLNKLIRVIAYCRRFISNSRHAKANRQTTTLTTQDLDQALTCCVKMVQQISFAPEIKDLTERKEVASTCSLKTLHPFIDREGFLRVG